MSKLVIRAVLALPILLSTACGPVLHPSAVADRVEPAAILRDIEYLASDRLEGRLAGTPGNDSAAAYIARRYRSLHLDAPVPGYLQPFNARSAADAHAGRLEGRPTQNVLAVVRGRDPVLRNEYIVIGAHFDHLGRSPTFAMDPGAGDVIRNGADDNASGTAAVLELARLISAHPLRRSVIFANFSAEELGLLGSQWFVEHQPVRGRIDAMLNFDMVGRLRNNKLIVYGTSSATALKAIVDSVNSVLVPAPFNLFASGDGEGPSDQASFYAKDIPVLHFFTDLHDDYHRATDDAAKIDIAGEARVVDLALRVAKAIDSRRDVLTFVRAPSSARPVMNRAGSQTYLGSVPDMTAGDGHGLRLGGVRSGSPAERGGLKAGDVIIEFGGAPVTDLYTYTDALYSHKPDETVSVVVLRGSERIKLTVTLGRRGQ